MGIHGIYQEIGRGERVALSKLAVEKFEQTGRPLRIAIDVSIWLFQVQAGKGGTNPAPRTFYYRLLRLVAFSIHPIFVFDGPNKPPFKRGKRTGANVSSVPDFLAKQLIKQFGFPIHYAPGEAEAECALLQRQGIVDAVLSEDVDTLMFGSGLTFRNWSSKEKGGTTPTHVEVYDAVKTKSGPAGLDREGMILVALMSGGDYVPEGIPGCGPKTACEAARAGFGQELCQIDRADKAALQAWKARLQHELKTNENKYFKRKHGAMKIPEDFPRLDILFYYTHPVVSSQSGLDALERSLRWDHDIDFQGLRAFTNDAFEWLNLEGAKHFIRNLSAALLVRQLRLRSTGERFTSDNIEAIKEDEALLVKGIHGKRQHPCTDNTPELRVSFTPIELVKIDLSKEDPSEAPSTHDTMVAGRTATLAETDPDSIGIDDDDDEPGVRTRGPTKFDPTKPQRIWVLETFVKVGVPLTAEDWEAERQRPRKAAAARETTKAATKAKGGRKAKTTTGLPQTSIVQFAKVTKPAVKHAQASSKPPSFPPQQPTLSQSSRPTSRTVVDLLSSSPAKPSTSAPHPLSKDKAVQDDILSSVTKRRKRGPMQRSRTLPSNFDSFTDRPSTPPPMTAIDTLDLISSPALPSPSLLPSKKARSQAPRPSPDLRPTRSKSVISTPRRTKQMTLDAWTQSSPAATPSPLRYRKAPATAAPIPSPPQFRISDDTMETLDLTASSPAKAPITNRPRTRSPKPRRTDSSSRPPLHSISSNSSFSSTSSSRSSKPPARPRRTSPRLNKTTPEITTLDLTQISSPPPQPSQHPSHTFPKPPNHTNPPSPPPPPPNINPNIRRSPRNHTTHTFSDPKPAIPSRKSTSPKEQAPWKSRIEKNKTDKKRLIYLRRSAAGIFEVADEVPEGKGRRAWDVGEVEEVDLC